MSSRGDLRAEQLDGCVGDRLDGVAERRGERADQHEIDELRARRRAASAGHAADVEAGEARRARSRAFEQHEAVRREPFRDVDLVQERRLEHDDDVRDA